MRLFISYARVDYAFCVQLADALGIHEAWYDERLFMGQRWWQDIVQHLDWCDGVICLLSPEFLASEYANRELDIALALKREVIPLLIHPDVQLPDVFHPEDVLDFSFGLNIENVTRLLNTIVRAERRLHASASVQKKLSESLPRDLRRPPGGRSVKIVGEAAGMLEAGQYDQAVFLLRQARQRGFQSRFLNLDVLLREAELALEKQGVLREAAREYHQIAAAYELTSTRETACEFYRAFLEKYPAYDHDPKGLRHRCAGSSQGNEEPSPPEVRWLDEEVLPMLKWCEVPAGVVWMADMASDAAHESISMVHVDRFYISKYPVTNAQYEVFLHDPAGYANENWWRFSEAAYAWRTDHPQPLAASFSGDDRPRETISWYEAMAFCGWLSHHIGATVTLPTVARWQRAAQGDDEREYPWGDLVQDETSNTREMGLKMTTSVTRYPKGVSPYGVYDMAGNVWEWCLDVSFGEQRGNQPKYAVLGGSYVSPLERARSSFRYYLNPETRFSSIGFRIVVLPDQAD